MSRNWEDFRLAVLVLVGPGTVKQRLIDAYQGHLRAVDGADLPESVGVDFAALVSDLNCGKAVGGLCAAEVAVRKLSELDAAAYSARIIGMFVTLSRTHFSEADLPAPPRLRVVGDDEDELPAFLSRA
jgi:hypothetical protein